MRCMTELFKKKKGFRPTNSWEKKMFQLKGNAPKSNRKSEMSDHRNLRPFKFDWAGWNWLNWKDEEFHHRFQFHTAAFILLRLSGHDHSGNYNDDDYK